MVELLVAMLLGLFLLYALVQILINGKQSFSSANSMSRLQENGRIATNMVVSELKRAGYMGGNSNMQDISGSSGKVDPSMTCPTAGDTWVRMVEQRVAGIDDGNTGYACIPDATYLRGDVLVLRHAAPWLADTFSANKVYLRSSLFEGRIFTGANAALSPANDVLDTPQNERELLAYAFFVGDSGRTCGGRVVPSLFRVGVDDNSQPVARELLPGIEDFQVQYGVSGPNDNIVDRYYNANDVPSWDRVQTVRIWLLVRGECTETGFTDANTYTYGDQNYTPGDNFRRQLYSSVVMVRN